MWVDPRSLVPVLLVSLGTLFAACGNDPNAPVEDDGPSSDSGGGRDSGPGNDAGTGDDSGSGGNQVSLGGGSGIGNPCVPESCEDQEAECGTVSDGCGDVLECGSCDDGEACGIVTDNVCTAIDELCEPLKKSEACSDKECGQEGDGCSGVYDCGECDDGESCGLGGPFLCGDDATSVDPGDCQARIESCESVGARCGVIGDGCGGTLDCSDELGDCPDGTYCGIQEAYQCDEPPPPDCTPADSCADLGWACGLAVDECGNVLDCAAEGRGCGSLEVCVGGIDGPTECVSGTSGGTCELCSAIPTCTGDLTRLSGRVITPGRTDANTQNQVGVPNAFVYILRNNDLDDLPAVPSGIPSGGTSCDRCNEQILGPILAGATTDATGSYTIEGNIPVGEEFILVVKVGKFRRATQLTLDASAACEETVLPSDAEENPTRLPRSMDDGLAVNLPHIAVSTGQLDGIECVFEKIGIAHDEFGNPGASGNATERIHLYRGGHSNSPAGARIDGNTPHDSNLYDDLGRLELYDIVVADCEGQSWDSNYSQRNQSGANVREYVNRGGRMFASHLSHSWLRDNGNAAYDAASPFATGLGPSATYQSSANSGPDLGTGIISLGRPNASPRIETFRDWMVNEAVTTGPAFTFDIDEPRSQVTALGTSSEEFVHCDGGDCSGSNRRTQQFSFNTPYGAPTDAACGRVAYSGFHVAIGSTTNAIFPNHCSGSLTDQEKVLLFMVFDLGACVGEEPTPPTCEPIECTPERCGVMPDGCGGINDCGPCDPPSCVPTSCGAQEAECGPIGDGCGEILQCGSCSSGDHCGADYPNLCGDGPGCTPLGCDDADAECGKIGDGCGGIVDCGKCPSGQVCGLKKPFQCDPPPPCVPIECDDVGAECGNIGDGCGQVLACGNCPSGEICTNNHCDPRPE